MNNKTFVEIMGIAVVFVIASIIATIMYINKALRNIFNNGK